jgi:hypothetical protein
MNKNQLTGICLLVIICIIVSLTALGCATTEALKKDNADYTIAKKENTAEAYKEYIEKYPDGKHVKDAKRRLVKLEWDSANSTNTIEAYNNFIKKYKGNPYGSNYIELAEQNVKKLSEQLALKGEKPSNTSDKQAQIKEAKIIRKKKASSRRIISVKKITDESDVISLKNFRIFSKTSWIDFFSRGWQIIFNFFNKFFSFLTNPPPSTIEE